MRPLLIALSLLSLSCAGFPSAGSAIHLAGNFGLAGIVGILVWDLRSINLKLRQLVSPKTPQSRKQGPPLRCLTKNGMEISMHLDLLSKVQNSKTQLTASSTVENAEEWFPEFCPHLDAKGDEMFYLFTRLADFLARRFNSDIAAVLVKSRQGDSSSGQIYCSRALRANALESAVASYIEAMSLNSSDTCIPVNPALISGAELYLQGITYTRHASFSSPKLQLQGSLFLAFKRPRFHDGPFLNSLAGSLSANLPRLKQERENSSLSGDHFLIRNGEAQILAHILHDIRSPLNNIRAVLKLLEEKDTGGNNSEIIDIGLNNCSAVSETIESILAAASDDAVRLRSKPREVNIVTLAKEVFEGYRLAAKLKGLDFQFEMSSLNLSVYADPQQTKRIISNLTSNAIKYTRCGLVKISVRDGESGIVELCVSDTGIGIEENLIRKLFSPFTRLIASECEGLGLGLTLSKALAELNKGRISVDSAPGKGSTFKLSLPAMSQTRHPCPSEPDSSTVTRASGEPAAERQLRVLLVDDDPDCVESVARNLEGEKVHILKAVSVSQASEILNFERPDAVIADNSMPDGGGLEVIKKARKNCANLPTAILSGSSHSARFLSSKHSADKVFLKPVELNQLRDWLGRIKRMK